MHAKYDRKSGQINIKEHIDQVLWTNMNKKSDAYSSFTAQQIPSFNNKTINKMDSDVRNEENILKTRKPLILQASLYGRKKQ